VLEGMHIKVLFKEEIERHKRSNANSIIERIPQKKEGEQSGAREEDFVVRKPGNVRDADC